MNDFIGGGAPSARSPSTRSPSELARHDPPDAAGGRLRYPVWVAAGVLERLGELAMRVAPAHRFVVISDTAVRPFHADRIAAMLPRSLLLDMPPGEAQKTRESWSRLTDAMLTAGCGRDSTVVAVGGGVVCDLAGFVAATFMRGVPVVQVPTTLLAMVDASVGGKTGVDTQHGKNLVGAFHPPAAVLADPLVLTTLPERELRAGLAEIVKHGVIADAAYLDATLAALPALDTHGGAATDALTHLIAGSVAIKANVVAADEREGGMRRILNFGHTIGHAVESLSGYAMLHGEAVAVGMVVEADAAERLGIAERGTAARVRDALRAARLPIARPATMAASDVVRATRGDKKARAGTVEYALPERIGVMASADGRWSLPVDDDVLLAALA